MENREKHSLSRRAPVSMPVAPNRVARSSREVFCGYLIAAREASGKSLDAIAGVTKIPLRSLERLEAGEFEKLPADVFVRGFVRSYARCVGLDEGDAIRRYAECGMTPAPVASPLAEELKSSLAEMEERSTPSFRKMPMVASPEAPNAPEAPAEAVAVAGVGGPDEAAAEPESSEPRVAEQRVMDAGEPVIEATAGQDGPLAVDGEPAPQRRRRRRKRRRKRNEASAAPGQEQGAPAEPAAEPQAMREGTSGGDSDGAKLVAEERVDNQGAPEAEPVVGEAMDASTGVAKESAPGETLVVGPAGQGREPASRPVMRPTLRIDDDRPEDAELAQAERALAREREDATWRNFLPPALLDPQEGSRRGALTLAVIILVIVATLTMSYLMRRPNDSGDGVTWRGSDGDAVAVTTLVSQGVSWRGNP